MKETIVSVIIPAFNRAHVIERAVQSVLAQTYQETEVIVVDDGSTDETVPTVTNVFGANPRVRLIAMARNSGAQAARNAGARTARGDWLAFLDSDDAWLPHSLTLRLDIARTEHVEVVHTEGYVLRPSQPQSLFGVPSLRGCVYRKLLRAPGPFFQTLLVSARAFARIGGLDERIRAYQEWDTSIRLAKYYRFGFSPQPTFIYDCLGTDTISNDQARGARGYEQVFDKHRHAILLNAGPRAISQHHQLLSSFYMTAGDLSNAKRHKRASFYWWPNPIRLARAGLRRTGSLNA